MVHSHIGGLLSLLTLTLGGATQGKENFFVRISEENRSFNNGAVIKIQTLSSVIECAAECLKISTCMSFNAKPLTTEKVTCAFLSDIPLSPEADLTDIAGRSYYEKTCQLYLSPTLAVEYEAETNGFLSDRIYLGADNGYNVYIVYLSPSNEVVNITFLNTVHDQTQGQFKKMMGMASLILDPDNRINIHLLDTGVMCLNNSGTTSHSCFSESIVSKTSLFGSEDVNALLPTPDSKGMYAFGTSRIVVMNVPISGSWNIINHIDLSPGNRPEGWLNIPRGIVGAAWVSVETGITSKAFLLTKYYYVIYDFSLDRVLKRDHLCPTSTVV